MDGVPGIVPILIVLAVAGLVIAAAVAEHRASRRRQQALAELAGELGLRLDAGRDTSHDDRYGTFEIFRRGHSRAAYNTLSGETALAGRPHRVVMGDFTYKVTSSNGKTTTTTTYRFSYLILHLPLPNVPDLLIRPEHLFDKLGSALGFDDIDFESAEFSRKFFVKSADKRFAYDVVTPAMMEFLLARRDAGAIDIERGMLALSDGTRRWTPEQFRERLAFADGFLGLWPEHVTRDLRSRGS
jgi:hypothetical protein